MSPTVIVVTIIAGVLQIGGLITAAVDLGQTWARQPGEHPSLPGRIFRPLLLFIWTKVFRRPWKVDLHVADVMLSADGLSSATGTATVGLRTDAPLAEQIAQLKSEVDGARIRADQAYAESAALRVALEQHRRATTVSLDHLRTEMQDWVRQQSAEAVPLAVVGLSATALGTLIQLVIALVAA